MEHLLAGGRARGIKCSPLYMLVHYRSESQTVESFLNLFPLILHIQPISTSDHFWLWKYVWILIDSQHLCRYYSNASHHLYLGYCNNCLWWTYSPVFYTAVSDPVSKKSDHVSPLQMLCCLSNSLRVKHYVQEPLRDLALVFLTLSPPMLSLAHYSSVVLLFLDRVKPLCQPQGIDICFLYRRMLFLQPSSWLSLSLLFPLGFCLTIAFFLRLFLYYQV